MLENKVVIITGSSRGIGQAVALRLSENKAKVVINYSKNDKDAERIINVLGKRGAEFMVYKGSVSDRSFVMKMIKQTKEKWGRIDVLVNNAGISKDHPLMLLPERDWDDVIAVNLKGAYYCTKAVLSTMIAQRWGRIINISSLTAVSGREGQTNYAAAKAGLIGFTKSLARETAKYNVLVNAIVVGLIDTLMTKRLSLDILNKIKKMIPLGRLGMPEEVANVCIFLSSEFSSYITGAALNVTGGAYM
ncbi:MAG: beta-ketoacyl-ACP reductase [Candidatus Njordarchaeales archaeon]